jgi:DNA-binding LacI/PurR family transcriptional regulator
MPVQRVTIRDVAREAGVSTTTVSDALSGNGRLPVVTRERVAAVASRLGYRASPIARSLRAQRAGSIGLYLPDNVNTFAYYLELAAGAASAALAHDMALTLIPPRADIDRVTAFPLDGLAAVDPVAGDPTIRAFSQLGIPVVTGERDLTPGASHDGRVEGSYEPVIRSLLAHLTANGAERIALIAPGPETAWGYELRAACRETCVIYDAPFPGSFDIVRAATLRALTARPMPDAIVSGIDGGALGTLLAAADMGLHVPDDLLVASCVDSPALRVSTPSVTAMDIQPGEVGRQLATLLHGLISGSVPEGTVRVVPSRLVIRESTVRGR